jgi:hypothetical protein
LSARFVKSVIVARVLWGEDVIAVRHLDPREHDLAIDERRRVELDGSTVELEHVRCERPRSSGMFQPYYATGIASAAIHVALLSALAHAMPPLDPENAFIDRETATYLMTHTNAPAGDVSSPEPNVWNGHRRSMGLDGGDAHRGQAGKLGAARAAPRDTFFSVHGDGDRHSVVAARIESADYGALSVLAAALQKQTPTTVFNGTGDEMIGTDPLSIMGGVDGEQVGESFGTLGLAPAGSALGGGGVGVGIGLGLKGSSWGGCGCGSGRVGFGYVRKTGAVLRINIPDADSAIDGELPPEVIRRVIRANFPRFRACYDTALRRDPSIAGSVIVRFVIDTTGAVETASLNGGTMSDSGVRSCTLSVYQTLSFPEPAHGKVRVTYPIDFQTE